MPHSCLVYQAQSRDDAALASQLVAQGSVTGRLKLQLYEVIVVIRGIDKGRLRFNRDGVTTYVHTLSISLLILVVCTVKAIPCLVFIHTRLRGTPGRVPPDNHADELTCSDIGYPGQSLRGFRGSHSILVSLGHDRIPGKRSR
jgi:hypothetical protein